jgi:GntR family transcriptional regulator
MYAVSRTVIRQALGELVYEGLITRIRGKGTFVAKPKIGESLVQRLTGFYHDMVERGYMPITEVLEQEVVPASPKVATYLKIAEGDMVLKLTRKRSIEDLPIVLVTTYLPHELCKGLEQEDFRNQSLYTALENMFGLVIVSGRRTLEAVPANEYEAQLLEIERGAPLILLDSISYLEDGTPIEYYHAFNRGDRTRFEVELVRYKARGETRELLSTVADPPQSSGFIIEEKIDTRSED